MEKKELNALIALLDDPDSEVFQHVSNRLMSYGSEILPTLENVWECSFDPIMQERVERIIQRIHFDSLNYEFGKWARFNADDLFEGAYLAAKYQYSELDRDKLKDDIERIRRTVWLELNHNLTPLEQVNVFNHVFYAILEYSGKATSKNYFINKVVENKCGNALMLGLLYLIVAHQLDIPIYGVNLSKHFILAFMKGKIDFEFKNEDAREDILFYINPLNKGGILSKDEIATYLEKIGEMTLDPKHFVPIPNKEVIRVLLENMEEFYSEEQLLDNANEVRVLIDQL